MEGLTHAVVGDLAKGGEGGFGGYGAKVWMSVERLEELCGAHGFAEGEDAVGMKLRFELIVQEIDPLVDVVALEESIDREFTFARAVGAGVR